MYSPTLVGGIPYQTIMQSNANRKLLAKIHPESQGWLTSALDPFHDFQYDVEGLPDMRTAPSVVQIHNQVYTLTAPPSVTTGLWDATVLYTGFNSLIGSMTYMIDSNSSAVHEWDPTALRTTGPSGSLVVWAGNSGDPFPIGLVSSNDFKTALGSVKSSDRCRLIGVAYEVHNTTAEIYRQGRVTTAQLADNAKDVKNVAYVNGTYESDTQADSSALFATSVADLSSVPGSSTWPAADGVYAIPRMIEIPTEIAHYTSGYNRVPIFYGSGGNSATPEPDGSYPCSFLNKFIPRFPAMSPSGFSPIQSMFTGLSPQTTLTITYRTIVEYFPSTGSALLPLAEPSPTFDPKVFELYSAVIRDAPYAVPVGQNAMGDYFRKVMKILSATLDATTPLFGEYAPLVSLAARGTQALSRVGKGKKVSREESGSTALQSRR